MIADRSPAADSARPPGARPPPKPDTPVQYLPGVGPKRAAALAKLGIATAGDLLLHFPFRHEEHARTTIADLKPDTIATITGRVTAFRPRRHPRGPAAMATVADNTQRCAVIWFNARHVLNSLRMGCIVELTGRVKEYRGLPQFVNPTFRLLEADATPIKPGEASSIEPVYPAVAEFDTRAIRKLIMGLLPALLPSVEEPYPPAFRESRKLPPLRTAIERLHRPTAPADVEIARRRLAYDELLAMQLAVQMARRRRVEFTRAEPLRCTAEIDARIRRRLPFRLTAAQDRVLREIASDLAQPRPMNRLLQGDVGSGKTAVATYAALVAVANQAQAVLLAPTELLAEQHHRNVARLLEGSQVRHVLWTGGGSRSRRAELRLAAEQGRLDLVVATQAVLEEDVLFARLGLVIIDEQHRFGVRQRSVLREKGTAPHYLIMTATPIPRTLAMTLYGDLDISTIDAMPPGRAAVRTRVIGPSQAEHAWRFVRSRLDAGEQAYVVYPLVEATEAKPLKAATEEAERLSREVFPDRRVALLHGQMRPEEKDAVMRSFVAGEVDVLVATTVIEVGIDVPNATVMVVQHAERYGLAQLHQLRGRVGRGGRPGYCYLMTDDERAVRTARLDVLTKTNDGFKIGEEDLKLRGPGELLGTRQHGLPALRCADLTRDLDLLRQAQQDAADILRGDPVLGSPDWRALKTAVAGRFGGRMQFLDVG
ncbi:MAG: ATP-dependent DNA helicase RecG [Phycisphaerae bacterium]|nr:ATP-dependent DNA helicase RecG [Phycisphaerae bacterium]